MKLSKRVKLKKEIKNWADKIKVKPGQVRIQRMKNKWASCSTRGWVSFNTDLLKESKSFQKYVIVHELLHLIIPNHGKLFKTMINIYLPRWERFANIQNELLDRAV